MFFGKADLPLVRHLKSSPEAKIRFVCHACGSSHDVDAAQAVWLLTAFGLGDDLSPIADAAKLALNPCARCRAIAWQAWPCEPHGPPGLPKERASG